MADELKGCYDDLVALQKELENNPDYLDECVTEATPGDDGMTNSTGVPNSLPNEGKKKAEGEKSTSSATSKSLAESNRPPQNLKKKDLNKVYTLSPEMQRVLSEEYNSGYYDDLPTCDIEDAETLASYGARGGEIYFDKDGVFKINGAIVIEEKRQYVSYEDTNQTLPNGAKQATGVKVTIDNSDEKELYLGKIFETTPYGIINKNRTGIGATTLEIKTCRDSIIVMPTKALAFSKATDNNKGNLTESGIYKCCYVGSKVREEPKHKLLEINEYLKCPEIKYRKFIVVADSLYKVINAIGGAVYNTYFLMLDEIDSYQSDSPFRESLSNTLDYYFEFDRDKRCMVTATLKEFSDPELNKEPIVEIDYTNARKRKVGLIHTNNPNQIAKEKIEELYNRGGKIVIAYNKIQFIRQIIENLGDEIKGECAILCSSMSEIYAGAYYQGSFENNKLTKRINFITCTYFTGIDIQEKFHLISISTIEYLFCLLTPEKLAQIAGRGREGLLSETIIYNTKPYSEINAQGKERKFKTAERYRGFLLNYAEAVREYINTADTLAERFKLIVDKSFVRVKQDIEMKSRITHYKGHKIDIVRENIYTGRHEIAYLNVDAIYEATKTRTQLYASPEQLYNTLKGSGITIIEDTVKQENRELSEQQAGNNARVNAQLKEKESEQFNSLIERMKALHTEDRLNEESLRKLRKEAHRKQQTFIDRFRKLYPYVPFEKLIGDLINIGEHKKIYRGYCNGTIFWALSNNHSFKTAIKGKFKVGRTYPPEEIEKEIKALYITFFHKELKLKNGYAAKLGEFIRIKREKPTTNAYKIISYNRNNFKGSPLSYIPDNVDTDLNKLIEFSGE